MSKGEGKHRVRRVHAVGRRRYCVFESWNTSRGRSPRADFHTGEDITCPDCGVQCDDDVEYVAGGTLYTCDDCGCNSGRLDGCVDRRR